MTGLSNANLDIVSASESTGGPTSGDHHGYFSTFSLHHIDWLADGPIGPFVDAFKQYLTERRYAATTTNSYLACIAHFARWARSKRLKLHRIDEVSIGQFLDDHLPSCNCAEPTRHDRRDHSAALGHLLVVLRAQGAIAPPAIGTTPVDDELRRYDEYMDHARGWRPRREAWRCASWGGC